MVGKALILVENLSVPFDRRVWQESTALRDAGWDVSVICPQGASRDSEPYVELDGVKIHRYPLVAATGGPTGYLKEYPAALWHTWRLARRIGPIDVVHACNPPDLFFLLARRFKRRGARFIFDQHDLVPELYLSRFDRGKDFLYRAVCWLERKTYQAADVVIATNESYRAAAISRGGKRPQDVFVVRSAPTVERFRQVPPDPTIKRGKPHLLCYLGVMGPQDGVDYALRALARLRDEQGRTDWHAAFIGAGDTFDAMLALADELGLADLVTFTGRVPDEDLLRYLSTADVCLSPDPLNPLNDVSTMNKIMEYMAMSRPIVSFDLREARVSAGEAAVYAPPNDESAFAKLVARLLDDPEERRRMGGLGRARVSGPLSWEHSRAALLAAYEAARAINPSMSRTRGAAAGVAAPAAPVGDRQPRQRPVEGQDSQVTGPVQRAHRAAGYQAGEGAQLQAAPGQVAAQAGELPVAPPHAHPALEVGPDGAGRAD
ncbi:Glycosyltransferase involved in cell wall bisynthesis [Micromonospora rhizosphaerae]|uniref:Glycosyltransferase involved in cell wall bisynthesis n=1 Tax=Micromonospora rhizosphaerae TaxID=568872 RepID=A0A1C6SX73_9ACTN|nr:glycosyltransferase family 4 protein [Micromonospora rhizosphaerae]SCL34151.1 Glycosyltransferase involved in cell wall bisynthesis [Micromonospora rhizosphaerae]